MKLINSLWKASRAVLIFHSDLHIKSVRKRRVICIVEISVKFWKSIINSNIFRTFSNKRTFLNLRMKEFSGAPSTSQWRVPWLNMTNGWWVIIDDWWLMSKLFNYDSSQLYCTILNLHNAGRKNEISWRSSNWILLNPPLFLQD